MPLVKDDRGDAFLYWEPSLPADAGEIDQKTMGISNVPQTPMGIAFILKEPGKAGGKAADDVTRMFPRDGSAGEAGYGAPFDSLNVAYNHDWWTCIRDEGRRKRHVNACCTESGASRYRGRCTTYRNYFLGLCRLVSSADRSIPCPDGPSSLRGIYYANPYYPSEPSAVGSTSESAESSGMDGTERAARVLGLIRWMRRDSEEKREAGGVALRYVFLHKVAYDALRESLGQPGDLPCLVYIRRGKQKLLRAFWLEDLGVWVISCYHPQGSHYGISLSEGNVAELAKRA